MLSIGEKGKKWNNEEFKIWLSYQEIKKSYEDDIVTIIKKIKELYSNELIIEKYGILEINNNNNNNNKYDLYSIQNKNYDSNKLDILITGGVHGYEVSGILGTLNFLINKIDLIKNTYLLNFNFLIIPCISAWSYETINRWNSSGVDVNRSFFINNLNSNNNNNEINLNYTNEANLFMKYINSLTTFNINKFIAHFDLHETTDTDATLFSPLKSLRDGLLTNEIEIIPDGFYTVTNSNNKQLDFQTAIINSVEKITHIAIGDEKNQLIEIPIEKYGIISLPIKDYGLCAGFTNAKYVTTTEVYPDSPKSNSEICISAQVAAICGGLDYIIEYDIKKL